MELKVISCNPSNEGSTFVIKSQGTKTVSLFGVDKVATTTYYISLPKSVEVGATFDVDLSLCSIVERPFEHPTTGEVINLKWLHIK